jgi:hypothetical protein
VELSDAAGKEGRITAGPDGAAPYLLLRDSPDFLVRIAWSGPEDKPFYKAVLCSASRADSASAVKDPFQGRATISRQEWNRLLNAFEADGLALSPGGYPAGQSEYFAEIEVPRGRWHTGLGFTAKTLKILGDVEAALETRNRQPVTDIIDRVGSHFPGRSGGARG